MLIAVSQLPGFSGDSNKGDVVVYAKKEIIIASVFEIYTWSGLWVIESFHVSKIRLLMLKPI